MALTIVLAVAACCGTGTLQAQTTAKQIPVPLPPMGWSSWNSFSNTVNSQVIQNQAKALAASGMQKAGYQYVNIDEGWWLGQRRPDGNIMVDPKAWPALTSQERPGDMSNIVRYVHGLGLKVGIYTDAGKEGCSTVGPDLGPSIPNTGSEGHYEQDFLQFAKWGFDYVKVDWCGGNKENLDPAVQYGEIARAIAMAERATGHTLYYSICDWGNQSPWTWAPGLGGVAADIWRTSGDIVAPIVANSKNSGRKASFSGMVSNFDRGVHPEAQHTGFYNDPDMMVIGMPGLTDVQNRVHMALWAMSGAPLIVGADLTTLSEATRATLTNPAVLAIDQDPVGLQAVKVAEPGPGLEVWAKALSTPGERAVLLLNRTSSAAPISVRWSDLDLLRSSSAAISDAGAQKDLGVFRSAYSVTVAAQDAILLVIRGSEQNPVRYNAVESGPRPRGKNAVARVQAHSFRFAHVKSTSRFARVEVTYTNGEKETLLAELRVNGRTATRVAFPPTGSGVAEGRITVQSFLDRDGSENMLTFSTHGDRGPTIQSISVH
ncbi:MAG TPA: alpha-galactosidase [Acidobacteriaceae bacterium]|nr:alpha-galactosidase [Acidobacteriaceae bacterium]